MAIYSTAQQIVFWYGLQIASRCAGLAFVRVEPNLYEQYKPFWGPPVWLCWVAWVITMGLEGYAAWAAQDGIGSWDYRMTLYAIYLGAVAMWPVFFFPAVKDNARGMMWMTVIFTGTALGLSSFLIWGFWDGGGAVPGAFMIPSVVSLFYVLLLTVVTVMKANYLDVGDVDRTPKQRSENRQRNKDARAAVGTGDRRRLTRYENKHDGACEAGRTTMGDLFFGVRPVNEHNPAYCGSRKHTRNALHPLPPLLITNNKQQSIMVYV